MEILGTMLLQDTVLEVKSAPKPKVEDAHAGKGWMTYLLGQGVCAKYSAYITRCWVLF